MTERFIANPCYGIPALKETSDMKRNKYVFGMSGIHW